MGQTEAEVNVSETIKKYIKDTSVGPELFKKISIQTIICNNGKKVLAVKLHKDILCVTQLNYNVIVKAIKQKFSDYFVIFIRNFDIEPTSKNVHFEEKEDNWLANACFPFLLTGLRTDVRSVDDSVTNVLLEKRTSFTNMEMEILGIALSELLGRNYVVGVNHHTKN